MLNALFALCLTLAGAAHAEAPLPWKTGDIVGNDWEIAGIERSRTAVRVQLENGKARTTIEIVSRNEDPRLPYKTRFYTVQTYSFPPPSGPLLPAVRDALRDWEEREGHVPFVTENRRYERETRMDFLLVLAYLILLPLLGWLLYEWTRMEPSWKRPVQAALGVAAVSTIFFVSLPTKNVPLDWITVLQGGPGLTDILHLSGKGVHAGRNFTFVSELWAGTQRLDLRDVVRMNLWLTTINALFFLIIGWRILGAFLPALAFTTLLAGNRILWISSVSEAPAQLLAAYLFAGILAGTVFHQKRGKSPAALAAIALLTILAALTRLEAAGFGIVALLTGFAALAFDKHGGLDASLARWASRIRRWNLLEKAGILFLLVILSADIWEGPGFYWLLDGARPLNPSIFYLPVAMTEFLPMGLILLTVLGIVHALRTPGAFLGLPIALIILFRTWHSPVLGSFCVMMRFMAFWLPAAFFLALFGWRELKNLITDPGILRRTKVLVLALFLVPPLDLAQGVYTGSPPDMDPWDACYYEGHQQLETRFLLRVLDKYPDKYFVSKNVAGASYKDLRPSYQWTLFGRRLPHRREIPARGKTLEEVVAGQSWSSVDVLYYAGIDCNRKVGPDCAQDTRGLKLLEQTSFKNPGLCDRRQYGEHKENIRLAVYRLP